MKTRTKTILASIYYGGLAVACIYFIMQISWTSGYMSRTLEDTQEDLTEIAVSLDGMLETTDEMIESTDEMIQSTDEMIEDLKEIEEIWVEWAKE